MLKKSMHSARNGLKSGRGSRISVPFMTGSQDASFIPPLITFLTLLRPSLLLCVRAIPSGKNGRLPQSSGVPLNCRTVLPVRATPALSLTSLSAD